MVAMGLDLTVGQIIAPLRNARLVVLSLLVNFVLMPLGALALAGLLRLDQPLGARRRAHRSYQPAVPLLPEVTGAVDNSSATFRGGKVSIPFHGVLAPNAKRSRHHSERAGQRQYTLSGSR